MFFKALTVAAAISGAAAQRPSNTSICDYYTTALLMNNTAENQLKLLTLVVNTAVIGNCKSLLRNPIFALDSQHHRHPTKQKCRRRYSHTRRGQRHSSRPPPLLQRFPRKFQPRRIKRCLRKLPRRRRVRKHLPNPPQLLITNQPPQRRPINGKQTLQRHHLQPIHAPNPPLRILRLPPRLHATRNDGLRGLLGRSIPIPSPQIHGPILRRSNLLHNPSSHKRHVIRRRTGRSSRRRHRSKQSLQCPRW